MLKNIEAVLISVFATCVLGFCSGIIVSMVLLSSLGIVDPMPWSIGGLCLASVLALALVKV